MIYEELFEGLYLIEDLLKPQEFLTVVDEFNSEYNPWTWKHEFSKNTHWYGLSKVNADKLGELTSHIYYGTTVGLIAKKILKRDLTLLRINTNIQFPGQATEFHTDNPPGKKAWTVNLFANTTWSAEWGGQFVVNYSPKKYFGISPIPNHAVLFDGSMWHKGESGIPPCTVPRMTIAWTFVEP